MALVVALAATLFIGGLWPSPAHAQPVLSIEAGCEPAVRPNEAAVVTCTASITNSGDTAATQLSAFLFFSESCDIPYFVMIDRTVNGVTVPSGGFDLDFALPDIGPGETLEASSRVVVSAGAVGRAGGSITVTSGADPSVSAAADICFDVTVDAAAPPTNLRVTKTLLTDYPEVIEPPTIEEPPPRPPDGHPVPIEPTPPPPPPDRAEFEIVVENVSGAAMNDVNVLDVQTGYGVVLESSQPAASNVDPASGRATWSVGTLAPGAQASIRATYAPTGDIECAYASDVVVVGGTPAGGAPEQYAAFGDYGIPVGPCDFGYQDCWHYPPEGDPTIAPCDMEVCWSAPSAGAGYQPVYDDCGAAYCWFYPPGGVGDPELAPCAEEICWFDYGPGGDEVYYFPVGCDQQFCEYTAPDGSTSVQDSCDFEVCWSAPPGGGAYVPVFGCGEFGDECWYTHPDGGDSYNAPCDQPVCFITAPEGAIFFGDFAFPTFCPEGGAPEECWPLPPVDGPFFSFPAPCGVEHCWAAGEPGSLSVEADCGLQYCWVPAGEVEGIPPELGIPPDLLVPLDASECAPGAEMFTTAPGGSEAPVETVAGVSTPAVIEHGTSQQVELARSSNRVPATLVRSEHPKVPVVNPPPPEEKHPQQPTKEPHLPSPPNLAEVLGLGGPSNVSGLPSAGEGPTAFEQQRLWALAAGLAVLGLSMGMAGFVAVRRRV